jgi:glyoxylase-like metal-dependent hydrolase (beta-lactamase superfamily II)
MNDLLRLAKTLLIPLAALLVGGLGRAAESPQGPQKEALALQAEITTASGIRIIAMRTGMIQIKTQHREVTVPRVLATPAIFLGSAWADWMPIISFAIVHPEGTILVDTGPAGNVNADDYYSCDKFNAVFYRRNLRITVPPEETLEARLAAAGIEPRQVTKLVVTHFHADHIGGVDLVPQAAFYTGEGNWPKHVGSFTCRIRSGRVPSPAAFTNPGVEGFEQSMALTNDGRVHIVPLPGHTPGHVGVAVTDGGRTWIMAGDATFDQSQSERGALAGVTQDFDRAVSSQLLLSRLWKRPNVVVLPAHDASVFDRLPR